MLNRIIINNFATIEHLSLDLGDSLNVITGETGAGKSVLVTAINTALGGRADTSMVRTGTNKSFIQIAGDKNGEEFTISREILPTGKSISKLNGEMVTLGQLRDFSSGWVDIHGQYDNQQILNSDNHIVIIDNYAGSTLSSSMYELRNLYDEYKNAKNEYDNLLHTESEAKKQRDFIEFEYNHIKSLSLIVGEEDELRIQLDIMKNREKIFSSVNTSYDLLHESDNSIISSVSKIYNELSNVSSYSEKLSLFADQINDIYYQLEDISANLRSLYSNLSFSEDELDSVSERLSSIEEAKRKYNLDIDGILKYMDELGNKLQMIENFEHDKNTLAKIVDQKYSLLKAQSHKVSDLRRQIAKNLEKAMVSELKDLDFSNSDFSVDFKTMPEIGPMGQDKIEFMISTNPGEPLMPLTKIASGGEISRIMLAFKHIIGDTDNIETMIFDEIDNGISGRAALVVGSKLKEISSNRQLICITHLPQIAAYGDDNYLITKDVSAGKPITDIEHLDEKSKIRMLASLFSGSSENETAIEAARDLIEKIKHQH
ncbi:MAG: DNA repair protein RecN [Clostridiales bacterium]|nr:DNA repair protein RecN [Clostridiales bacterium]